MFNGWSKNWKFFKWKSLFEFTPNKIMCSVWKPLFHHKNLLTIRSNFYLYLYSEAVSSYISGEKLINLRSRNPKVVHVPRINSAMCLLVAALSILPDTTEQQIHLAEKFRTKRYGENYFYDCSCFSWSLRRFYRLCLNKIYGSILTDPLYFGCWVYPTREKSRIRKSASVNPDLDIFC
jgi:hypothetical protein